MRTTRTVVDVTCDLCGKTIDDAYNHIFTKGDRHIQLCDADDYDRPAIDVCKECIVKITLLLKEVGNGAIN